MESRLCESDLWGVDVIMDENNITAFDVVIFQVNDFGGVHRQQ